MDSWAEFWKYACAVGFGAFAVLVLAVIPLGARDILRLFRYLNQRDRDGGGD